MVSECRAVEIYLFSPFLSLYIRVFIVSSDMPNSFAITLLGASDTIIEKVNKGLVGQHLYPAAYDCFANSITFL